MSRPYSNEVPNFLLMVSEFNVAFGVCQPQASEPSIQDKKVNTLRISLLNEETGELKDAIRKKEPIGILDALCDISYVLSGAALSFGLQDQFREMCLACPQKPVFDIRDCIFNLRFALDGEYVDAVIDILHDIHLATEWHVHHFGMVGVMKDAFREVHRSNMSKIWTPSEADEYEQECSSLGMEPLYEFVDAGQKPHSHRRLIARRKDGKIIKSPSYSPADLSEFFTP